MKQSLQLKLGQQLTMTPQLQQAIRLLQLSTLDLQAEIQEALESNPMLEVGDEQSDNAQDSDSQDNSSHNNTDQNTDAGNSASSSDAEHSDNSDNSDKQDKLDNESMDGEWNEDIPEQMTIDTDWDEVFQPSTPAVPASKDYSDLDFESRRGSTETLQEHLNWQLNLTPMSEQDNFIAETIIDAVEPSGFLGLTLEDLHESLANEYEALELDEVQAVLHRIQQFDPPGVASQNIQECLLIQLKQRDENCPIVARAKCLIEQYLDLLSSRDFKQLMRKMKVNEAQLKEAVDLVRSLNPHPGESIGESNTEYVVPDVFVSKNDDGRWRVQLNPDVAPKLRINNDYASLVKRADSSSDNTFLRDNLQEARWFLKSLQSRNETLLKVATCIVDKQRGFLDHGPEAMKPMVLADIAELVEMHESTISRVTTQKYMHTPQGIFELKYFFSSHVSTEGGGECSSTAIRAFIKKLVAEENPKKPLSDAKIADVLSDRGIKVARRTIAKYRESLHIPPSNERKRLV